MKLEMEILSPANCSNWLLEQSKNTKWTHEENKQFENALAIFDKETPDRWHRIASVIPGKTIVDVIKQYKKLENDVSDIEAGLIPIPGYTSPSFTLEWENHHHEFDGFKQSYSAGTKRTSLGRPSDQERKKGVPWTEDEHRLFLLGLEKHGKGDWRNISRNFVVSRTPTQVASHAQKFFMRQQPGGKDKRRSSIHDITTVNPTDTTPPSPDDSTCSPDQSTMLPQQPNKGGTPNSCFDCKELHDRAAIVFNSTHRNLVVSPPNGVASYGMNLQEKNLQRGVFHGSHFEQHSTVLQAQPSQHWLRR